MLSVFANINIDKNCYEHLTFISNIKNNKSIYNKFCVCVARIRGHVTSNTDEQHSNDYYTFISNNINKVHSGVINDIISKKLKDDFRTFVFVNKQNLNGFINYIKTDFVRAILKLYKNNMNINIGIFKHIPWQDFSDEIFSKSPREIDDYLFEIDGKLAKEYLSEGEQKSAVIAFKLSEIQYCINVMKTTPILILDDLFSALDDKKINKIIGSFNKNFQIFITTTDLNNLNKRLLKDCLVIKIKDKKVEVKEYE